MDGRGFFFEENMLRLGITALSGSGHYGMCGSFHSLEKKREICI